MIVLFKVLGLGIIEVVVLVVVIHVASKLVHLRWHNSILLVILYGNPSHDTQVAHNYNTSFLHQ